MDLLKQMIGAIFYTIWTTVHVIIAALCFLFGSLFDILTLGIFGRGSDWE